MPQMFQLKDLQPGADSSSKAVSDYYDQVQAQRAQAAQRQQDHNAALSQLITGKQMDLDNRTKEITAQEAARQQGLDANIGRTKSMMNDLNNNSRGEKFNIHMGNDGISVAHQEPNLMAQQVGHLKNEAGALQHMYENSAKPIENQTQALESGLQGLNLRTSAGDKQAIIAATRLSDGAGQRITNAQLAAIMPHNFQGDASKWLNYMASQPDTTMDDRTRQAFGELFKSHSDRLNSEHQGVLQDLQAQAPYLAPLMNAQGQLTPYMKTLGGRVNSGLGRVGDYYSKVQQMAQPPQGINKPAGGLAGFLKSTIFGANQAAPDPLQGPSQSPGAGSGAPSSFAGVTPDAIQAELQRRKQVAINPVRGK